MILNIGQRVILPKLEGKVCGSRKRAGTVTGENKYFYVVKTDIGYNECIHKEGESRVKAL